MTENQKESIENNLEVNPEKDLDNIKENLTTADILNNDKTVDKSNINNF